MNPHGEKQGRRFRHLGKLFILSEKCLDCGKPPWYDGEKF